MLDKIILIATTSVSIALSSFEAVGSSSCRTFDSSFLPYGRIVSKELCRETAGPGIPVISCISGVPQRFFWGDTRDEDEELSPEGLATPFGQNLVVPYFRNDVPVVIKPDVPAMAGNQSYYRRNFICYNHHFK